MQAKVSSIKASSWDNAIHSRNLVVEQINSSDLLDYITCDRVPLWYITWYCQEKKKHSHLHFFPVSSKTAHSEDQALSSCIMT